MAHHKIIFWYFVFDRVSPLLALKGSRKHLLGHISSFECCNLAKKNLVPPWVISNFCYYWCTVVRWREMYVFFENDLFDPGIGYYTPCVRTFQGLNSVRLWTPTIFYHQNLKIIISKKDLSDQDHIKKKYLDLKSRSKIIFCPHSPKSPL
jgi:hypothetical protein